MGAKKIPVSMPLMTISVKKTLPTMVSAKMVIMHVLVARLVTSAMMTVNGNSHVRITWMMDGAVPSRTKATARMKHNTVTPRNVQPLVDSAKEMTMMEEMMRTTARTRNLPNGAIGKWQMANAANVTMMRIARIKNQLPGAKGKSPKANASRRI